MNDQQQSRTDALTDDQRQALGEAISEHFGKLDSDEGIRTPDGRILRAFDYCDSRTIDDLIDCAIVPAFAASPVEQPAPITAQAALAAIETFEIVGENNDSREPNADDRFILTEYIAHLFSGSPVEQPAAAPIDDFNGDTNSLIRSIMALLEMDAAGVLVPHGVGDHGRKLLAAAAARLAAVPPHEPGPKQPRQLVAQSAAAMTDERAPFEAAMRCDADLSGIDPSFIRNGDGYYVQREMQAAWAGWQARAASANETGAEGFSYASKQATACAGCGEHKHTPLRIDWMGGYVCLTCIDRELESRSPATAAEAVSIYQVAFDNAEEWLDADKKVFDTHPAHSRRIVYTAPQPPAQQVPSAGATLPDWAVTRAGSARDDADALKMAMRDCGMNDDNSAAFDFGAGFMRGIALGRALLAAHREPVTARPTHPDNLTVDRLAVAMKVKLAEARAKGRSGWEQCSPADLSRMLREHVEKGDPRDVANFCAFLWDLRERIAAQPQPPIKCHGSPLSPTCPSTTCGIQRSSAELTDDDMRDAERYRAHIKYEYETLYMPRAEKKGLRPLAFAEYKASADQVADAARTQGSQS
ncbi:hypothetical protein [Burkholderia thailandensis]|uniref:hypothetical protein n=1 Tax=Burkholderia thailandensis TaxID=57975 RepID=UPI001EE3C326|nr:hypothetical protein [Burkholderia thailandensis]